MNQSLAVQPYQSALNLLNNLILTNMQGDTQCVPIQLQLAAGQATAEPLKPRPLQSP